MCRFLTIDVGHDYEVDYGHSTNARRYGSGGTGDALRGNMMG